MLSARYSVFIMLIFKLLLYSKATPQHTWVPRTIFRGRSNWLLLINYYVQLPEAPPVREIPWKWKQGKKEEMRGREPTSAGSKEKEESESERKRSCKHQVFRKRYKTENSGSENQRSKTEDK